MTSYRVLIVDDEPEVQRVIAMMLSGGGYVVALPRSGATLLEQLETLAFDLVITDMKMPCFDGWAVLQWVRANRPGVPVLLVSGDIGQRLDDASARFDGIMAKPVRRATLLPLVAQVLAARSARVSDHGFAPGPIAARDHRMAEPGAP